MILLGCLVRTGCRGGANCFLHVDDWAEGGEVMNLPGAYHPVRWRFLGPPGGLDSTTVRRPIFRRQSDAVLVSFSPGHPAPESAEQAAFVRAVGELLNGSRGVVPTPPPSCRAKSTC